MSNYPELLALECMVSDLRDGTHGTHERTESGVPFLSAKNITDSGFVTWNEDDDKITERDYQALNSSFTLKSGDLLLTIVGSLGRRAIFFGEKVTFQRSVAYIRPRKEKVFPKYLFYAVGHESFRRAMIQRSNATAQAGLYLGELAKINVGWFPINEQRLIAHILDTLDTQIQKTDALIAKLEKVKEGLLHDLLTRGIGENGQLRPNSEQAPELYKESPLGLIPKPWNTAKLSELILEHNSGLYTPKSNYGRGTPMLGVSSLYAMDVLQNQELRRAPIPNSMLDKYILNEGDIVYGESSLVLNGIAKTVVVGELGEGKGFEWHTRRIRVDKSTAHPGFISAQLSHFQSVRNKIMSVATQTALTGMTTKDFFSVSVVLPNINEQKIIFRRLGQLDERIEKESSKLTKLKSLKKGLMDDLLTGRVRVTPLLDQAQTQAQPTTPA
ncbi:restriction endonuclease subunit S [Halomonas lysinitropha]|uniref:Type-1 restriction enzyme EcoKI specificity protein n=1 Tax=Halomonas lysinitropha TaxID=2607506 RepID=A0A5K1I684_9GAMM|nr:restriction endonuclease subunit S [Halomonas lysinitropha]VVZ94622.1 Type-1 restriction enzyme EcoKI specificity protein [Halomonas lysinitropha]